MLGRLQAKEPRQDSLYLLVETFQLFPQCSQALDDVLVYRRDADAKFFGSLTVRATIAVAHSDDGGCLGRQVVVDAIYCSLPSFLQLA